MVRACGASATSNKHDPAVWGTCQNQEINVVRLFSSLCAAVRACSPLYQLRRPTLLTPIQAWPVAMSKCTSRSWQAGQRPQMHKVAKPCPTSPKNKWQAGAAWASHWRCKRKKENHQHTRGIHTHACRVALSQFVLAYKHV